MIVSDLLEQWGHEVVCAEDGAAAWQHLEDDPSFSLVVTDWVMPNLDGPELCRRIRTADRTPYLPVLLSTSLDQEDHLADGLDAGADAFLSKPISPGALAAQIRVVERILRLQEKLEARVRSLQEAHDCIERDLRAAAEVQMSHLPNTPPALPSVEFAWVYDACQTLGGDMFNVFRLDEKHVGVYILDVSGHGTSAALLSVSLSRALVPNPQQGGILKRELSEPPYYEIVSPAEVAAELNRRFQLILQSGHFCTFLYAVLDLESRELRYVSAGHPGPIRVEGDAAEARAEHDERAGGIPIGVLEDAEYEEEVMQLQPGAQVVLYTDGVNEAANPEGEQFGTQRILGILSENHTAKGHGVEGSIQALRKGLIEFSKGKGQLDDITIVGIGFI